VEFYDIAGIIKGAAQGEGLGNKFLSHIRDTSAIILVARFFDHPDVVHVTGKVDPKSDLETVLLELILADLETVVNAKTRYERQAKSNPKEGVIALPLLASIEQALSSEQPASTVRISSEDERKVFQELQLLTGKPMLIVANVGENEATRSAEDLFTEYNLGGLVPSADWIIPISAKLEAELVGLAPEEQQEFLQSYGLKESGLNRLAHAAYHLLGLQTYFTAGPKEVRAWTIRIGAKAPEAAGVIHTDFERGFIRAEVIAYADYVSNQGEQGVTS
jgi:ribosome-binding ATPase